MPTHNSKQHGTNIVSADTMVKDFGISNLLQQPPTIARTLTRDANGRWWVDKHDGNGVTRITKAYYIPDFVVTRITTTQLRTAFEGQDTVHVPGGWVSMIDMPNTYGLQIMVLSGQYTFIRATKIYLTAVQDLTNIILLG